MSLQLVYLHGFASSPGGTKASFFRDRLRTLGLHLRVPELAPDFRIEIAGQFTPGELIAALPGVPALKQNRAVLAIAAFRAALLAAHSRPTEHQGRVAL